MDEIGFARSDYDPGVFYYLHEGVIGIIVIHVDDCVLVTNGIRFMRALKEQLAARYEIADLGEARWLLGLEIRHDRAACTISLSQATYIDTLLARFNMTSAHPLSIPFDPHSNIYNYTLDD